MTSFHYKRKKLLKNPSYLLYLWATTISFFGNGMQFISSSWLALTLTKSNYSVVIILILSTLPGIILSPFLGVIVDRLNRKKLAVFTDFFRVLVLISIPIIWWTGELNVYHIYIMTFLIALGDTIFQPTVITLIREIIPKKLLLISNSTTQITAQVGSVVGAAIGGIIVAFYAPVWVMLVNAVTFLISGICFILIPKIKKVTQTQKVLTPKTYLLDIKMGLQYITENKQIGILYLIMLSYPITLRTINTLLPIFSKDVLKVGAAGFGYIDAGFAIGAIIGGFYIPIFVKKFGDWTTMMFGIALLGTSILIFSVSFDIWSGIIGYFLIGLTFQSRIVFMTTIQQMVNLNFLGRVHSFYMIFVSISALIVYLLIGKLLEYVSSRLLFSSLGIIIIGTTLFTIYYYNQRKIPIKDISN